ncbi:MAG: ATP-binding cassette domain-containing protein, partial [Myxococcota bacterium]
MNAPALLTVSGLTVEYTPKSHRGPITDRGPVVRDVSFDVEAGKVVAIVGQSGSGKSTIARAILGL